MTKDEFIRAVAELLAALQFPVSLPETMKENLIVADDYEEAIRWTLES
jgi:hypothetical protein